MKREKFYDYIFHKIFRETQKTIFIFMKFNIIEYLVDFLSALMMNELIFYLFIFFFELYHGFCQLNNNIKLYKFTYIFKIFIVFFHIK